MKTKKTILILAALVSAATTFAQDKVKVEIENTEGGTFTISPEIPSDGMVAKGTVFTVTAKPEKGYVFDCAFQGTKHQWGTFYNETNDNPGKIVADHNITIGAAFLPESNFKDIEVTKNVVYVKPGKKELKYDVYAPKKAKSLPIVVIVHGGGWSSNVEDIMRGMGREIAKSGRYIAVSIDYRFIGKGDGEETPVEMYQIIEDVYGAIAHIMEHAAEYGGDPTRIFITGDSAGGHLSAAAINFADYIGDGGFGRTAGVYEFKPAGREKRGNCEEGNVQSIFRSRTYLSRAHRRRYETFLLHRQPFGNARLAHLLHTAALGARSAPDDSTRKKRRPYPRLANGEILRRNDQSRTRREIHTNRRHWARFPRLAARR